MIGGGGHCTRWEDSTLDFGNDGEGGEDGEKDGDGEQPGKRAGDSKLMRRRLKWDFRHLHNNDFNVGYQDQDHDGVDYQDVDQMKRNKSCCFYFGCCDIITFVS